MPSRQRVALIVAGLALLVFPASSLNAGWIDRVTVLPSCAITPADQVTLEVFVITGNSSAFSYQPTEVALIGNQVFVDMFVDSGMLTEVDSLLETVNLGRLEPGAYEYTVVVHYPNADPGNLSTTTGNFTVARRPCVAAVRSSERMYWADGSDNTIKRAPPDGAKVENLAVYGLSGPTSFVLNAATRKIYWTERRSRKIRRADSDGGNVEDLVESPGGWRPGRLTLDANAGKMYWVELSGVAGRLRRADLDGTEAENLVVDLRAPFLLVLDTEGGKMYWSLIGGGQKIQRANLDGSEVEDLVTDLVYPTRLTLDVAAGKMYWGHRFRIGESVIQRANLDGTEIEDLITGGLREPGEIVLDTDAGKMYWTDSSFDSIRRANLDGTEVEEVATTCHNGPSGLVLDSRGGKIYWFVGINSETRRDGKIMRANLDGSDVEDVVRGLGRPFGLVFDHKKNTPPGQEQIPARRRRAPPPEAIAPPKR